MVMPVCILPIYLCFSCSQNVFSFQVLDTIDGPKTYLVGVVSFGPTQCGINKPGVYVSVPKFTKWILNTILNTTM